MKIKVEQKHIDNGYRGSSIHCPVALAIIDATHDEHVSVGTSYITLMIDHVCRRFLMPTEVKQKICAFDCRQGMGPFEFELPLEKVR